MENALLWLAGVGIFLVVFTLTVGIHEAAHMVVAKKVGVRVPEFSVGFGSKIWSKKIGDTKYGFGWMPLGGYVKLEDQSIEDDEDPQKGLLSNVAPWKRVAIYAAGPLVNVVIGFAMLFGFFLLTPYSQITTTIDTVSSCTAEDKVCGALDAGILKGDKVLEINGTKIDSLVDFEPAIGKSTSVDVQVLRGGEKVLVEDVAITDSRLGVIMLAVEKNRTAGEAVAVVGDLTKSTVEGVMAIPSKMPGVVKSILGIEERSIDSPGSVVSVGKVYGDVNAAQTIDSDTKVRYMVLTAASLNLGIGIINLLPISPLDGGRILFALIDSVRLRLSKIQKKEYKPTPYGVIKWATIIPAFFLFAIMGLLIAADIIAPINIL